MKTITSKITVGEYELAGVVELSIDSSWDMLTDRCELVIPSNVIHQQKRISLADDRLVKRGDRVSVELGYDGALTTRFEGYVTGVKTGSPVRILCEDEMYVLKQTPVTLSYEQVTLKQLLSDILPNNIGFQAIDLNLGAFRITRATPAQVLQELKKEFGLNSWFRDGRLYCGKAYWDLDTEFKVFKFQYNIISDDLEYRNTEDVKLMVRAISVLDTNEKIEVSAGANGGEEKVLYFYNVESESQLRTIAEESVTQLRYDGWRGSFETFGEPVLRHGDRVELIDEVHDRSGFYLVKRVETKGMQGLRQIGYLDRKL